VRLIDDLLDLSRISRGKVELRKERTDLAAVVQNALETSRPVIEQRGHELAVRLPPEPVFVEADVTRLSQVFANLLNNAAKYTEPGGRIALTVERRGKEVAVSVRDNGVGIPAHMLHQIFDMFTQVDRSLERSQGGLGIGLSIVKHLVDMHGGSIEANSQGPQQGSEFVVRLPAAAAVKAKPAPTAEGRAAPDRPSGRLRVLVADDNADSVSSLALMLEFLGHEVRTAQDGQEAVEAAEAFRPDAILLDIGMPKMSGYDACRRIREQPWGSGLCIAALTGWGQDEDKRRSREAGFDRHFVKPVEPAALETMLAGLRRQAV
jgi:CheY-like chemotaxis protein/two-component sensor histidine kinase